MVYPKPPKICTVVSDALPELAGEEFAIVISRIARWPRLQGRRARYVSHCRGFEAGSVFRESASTPDNWPMG